MNKNYKEIFAKNLTELMRYHGDNMSTLAKKAGVDPKTISHCIRVDSRVSPTLEKVNDVAKVYKVDVWKLFIKNAEVDFMLSKESFMKMVDGDKGKVSPRIQNAINFLSSPPAGMDAAARDIISMINSLSDMRKASLHKSITLDSQARNHK